MLFSIVPIALRISIFIVNIDTSKSALNNTSNAFKTFQMIENRASQPDLQLKMNDDLNLHDNILYVLRKDGHYDILYQANTCSYKIRYLYD